jgi:uncharacterized protein
MTKILILVAAVVVIVWLLKRALASRSRDGQAGAAPDAAAAAAKAGQLVACAHCGVNLPQAEARGESVPKAVPRYYCSEEHLRAGPRAR